MVVYKRSSILIGDLYCGEDAGQQGVDVIRYNHWPQPLGLPPLPPLFTRIIDLTRTQDEIFADIKSTQRRHIRQAERDTLLYDFEFPGTLATLHQFADFYDDFAPGRGLDPLDRNRMEAMAAAGRLDINRVTEEDPESGARETLVWHVHYRAARRAVLLYTCSAFREETDSAQRNRIGRANRYLHWQELVRWKEQRLEAFDFGGWYEGNEDQQRLQINRFKEELGGIVVPIYNGMVARTVKGRLALTYLQLKRWHNQRTPTESEASA